VSSVRVFRRLLGVEHTVVEGVELVKDDKRGEEVLVASVLPVASHALRCSGCRRRCPYRDAGDGRCRWRTLDLGTVQA
jgi:transposase